MSQTHQVSFGQQQPAISENNQHKKLRTFATIPAHSQTNYSAWFQNSVEVVGFNVNL